jgi:hypothetical protein
MEFAVEHECTAGPSNAEPMHNPFIEVVFGDHVNNNSEETDTRKCKKKKVSNKKKNCPGRDMG